MTIKQKKKTKPITLKKSHAIPKMQLLQNTKGTRILILPNRSETITASIYFYFKVGSKNEPKHINGISHFIEHLCFKGSPKFPNYLDISKTFDSNGISFNAFTSKDITAYHYKFLSTKENIDIICKITEDMIFNPIMREKDLKTERNVIMQEYNDDADDIDEIIDEKIEECLLEGHPLSYSIIGTFKTINDISRKDIIDFHKQHYRPDNLIIGLSGKFQNEYITMIKKYFGGVDSYKNISLDNTSDRKHDSDKFKNTYTHNIETMIIPFIDKHPEFKVDCFPKDLKQDYIHIIFKTRGYYDPNKNQYKLLMNILAGNMSSRLFVEVREKLGLVYSIKSDISNYEEVGYVDIYTQNEAKDTLKCIEAIFKQLDKIKENAIPEKELMDNKKNYCDTYKTDFDDIEYENEHYSRQILLHRQIETVKMRIDSIQAITASELQNVARDLFNYKKVHIIAFGKSKKNAITNVINKFC